MAMSSPHPAGSRAPASHTVAPGHRARIATGNDRNTPHPGDVTARPTFSVDLTHLITAALCGEAPVAGAGEG